MCFPAMAQKRFLLCFPAMRKENTNERLKNTKHSPLGETLNTNKRAGLSLETSPHKNKRARGFLLELSKVAASSKAAIHD